MKILCIHQNFPGQFRDIAPALVGRGHEVRAICSHVKPVNDKIKTYRYEYKQKECSGIHQLTKEVDEWIHRSELAAEQANLLKGQGWAPDVILGHPGWGETLLLKRIYPSSALILWPELWLGPTQLGQTDESMTLQQWHYLQNKNSLVELSLSQAQTAMLPTQFQADSFPKRLQNKIKVLHEGVEETMFQNQRINRLTLTPELTLGEDTPVVTYISRNLEPMRGFPTFMRSLVRLQALNKRVHIVIVGGDGVSYSSASDDGRSWKDILLHELEGQIDLTRIHFFPRIPHEQLIKLYLRSDLHVYLSSAFVLSWSLIEIMACGTPVIGNNNAMIKELIKPGITGALYQGDEKGLGEAIHELLKQPQKLQEWGKNSKQHIQENYALRNTIDKLEELLKPLAATF